jgi:DNA polymerase III subunit gamma/tau
MSNQVLYRKYRPQTFKEVLGQDHIKQTLMNAINNGRIAHAYLFTGPRGVGKTTIARILARGVNCPDAKQGEPCNICPTCQEFVNSASLDVMEIDAASHTGVDNIRELIDHLKFAPAKAKYKVIIIDEVHMLSKGAFNALLKSLEEPPAHAIFVLATTEIHKVPATIISRTQRFDFKKISLTDLIRLLEFVAQDNNRDINPEALSEIAVASDGSFRDSLSLLDQVLSFSDNKITTEIIEDVLGLTGSKTTAAFLELLDKGETKQAVNFISNLVYSGRDLYQFQKDFLEHLRKVLLQKIEDNQNTAHLVKIINLFQTAGSELKWASVPSLPLEIAAVEATSIKTSTVIASEDSPDESERSNLNPEKKITTSVHKHEPSRKDSDNSDMFANIKKHWSQVLEKVKDYNHSLISSLKLAELVEIQDNHLILLFPYKFHKDAIEARKNRLVVDQAIEEVIGKKIMVIPVVKKDYENGKPIIKKETLVKSALEIMGGEVEK